MGMSADLAANFGYAMIKSGPDVNPVEVESERTATEVMVLWGTNVLHVVHLAPSGSFAVGDDGAHCDYFVPSEVLGVASARIAASRDGVTHLLVPPRATGYVDAPGEERASFAELVRSRRARPSTEMDGAYDVTLPPDAKARIELAGSDLAFQVNAIYAGRRLPVTWVGNAEPAALLYTGLSFVLHAGLLAAVAFFIPNLRGDDAESLDADRILMMQKLLNASAEREREARVTPDIPTAPATTAGGAGATARGQAGTMGAITAKAANHRYAVAGPQDNPDPHLAKMRALDEAAHFAAIGILEAMAGGDPNAPTAVWGHEEASGRDVESALGNMIGDTIGQANGTGGLDLWGTGESGDGHADSIGLSDFGPDLGHGRGGPTGGIGSGRDRPGGGHPVRELRMRDAGTTVNGRIPPEVIQRIVHQNFGRFRLCYQNGLRQNPTLEGRVTVRFAIDRSGAVAMSTDGGSDLPDHAVVACVVRAFVNLSFPPPEGGIVSVVYPIAFTPGS